MKSDHLLVSFSLTTEFRPSFNVHETQYVINFSKLNYLELAEYILNFDFSPCLNCNDIEIVWNQIRTIIHNAISLFAPKLKLRSRKNYPKWYNSKLRHHINRVRYFRRQSELYPTSTNTNRLEKEESFLLQLMSSTKSNYETVLVDEFAYNNNSKIYKYINSILQCKSLPATMYLSSQTATCDQDKVTLFNQFFESVYSKSDHNVSQSLLNCENLNFLNEIQITGQDVFTALSNLNPCKASGIDSIGPKVLKSCSYGLYEVLHHLFSLSLKSGKIPTEWKVHCIVPVYKSGDKCSIANYRPISLLCSVSKVLERLVYDKLFAFLENKISINQFGFLRNHSCVQQLLCFLHNISKALDNKSQFDVIYLDFMKAFDKVSHQNLLLKLQQLGIKGKVWNWIYEYLSNRQQLVSINGVHSSLLPVLSGVPQGSILGPLLFLVFINDLSDSTKFSNIHLFADDTKCSHAIKLPEDVTELQEDIDSLHRWSDQWSLPFNESKCVHMNFYSSTPSIQSNYSLSGTSIAQVSMYSDLGLILQKNLKWNNHYNYISAKAYRQLGLIKRTFSSINSVFTKKRLYLSLVRSQLMYGSQLWRPLLIKDITALEKIQRRATKFILSHNSTNLSYKERLIQLNILPLMYYLELADIMMFVNSYKSTSCRFNILQFVTVSKGNTRSSNKLTLKHMISFSSQQRHFYFNRIPRLWNSLPSINLDLSSQSIRAKIKSLLWENFLNNFVSDCPCTFHFKCPCSRCTYT